MGKPLTIAVVADTHDRIPPTLGELLLPADEIWHLGDVCVPDLLWEIQSLGPPVYVVRGNNDWTMEWPLRRILERKGKRFLLVHIPPARAPRGIDAVVHGHTHVPRDEVVEGTRFLNPGCVSRPNRGAPAGFAMMRLTSEGDWDWTWRPIPRSG